MKDNKGGYPALLLNAKQLIPVSKLFGFILLLPLFSCSSWPRTPEGFEGEYTPYALLMRSVDAYGGPGKVLDFKKMTCQWEVSIPSKEGFSRGISRLELERSGNLTSELRLEDAGCISVRGNADQSREWIDGKPTDRDVQAVVDRLRRSTLIHAFFLEDRATGVELSPPVIMEGEPCAVLALERRGQSWKIWIDLNQFLIRKKRLVLPAGDEAGGIAGPLSMEWSYSGFEMMDGRLVPTRFKLDRNSRPFMEGRITRFDLE